MEEENKGKQEKKVLFITYNGVEGIPKGIYEDERIVVFDREYCGREFESLYKIEPTIEARTQAIRALEIVNNAEYGGVRSPELEKAKVEIKKMLSIHIKCELKDEVDEILNRASRAYIYCGTVLFSGGDYGSILGRDIIDRMKNKRIECSLVGCGCYQVRLTNVAIEKGMDFILSGCGGNKTLGSIAESYENRNSLKL